MSEPNSDDKPKTTETPSSNFLLDPKNPDAAYVIAPYFGFLAKQGSDASTGEAKRAAENADIDALIGKAKGWLAGKKVTVLIASVREQRLLFSVSEEKIRGAMISACIDACPSRELWDKKDNARFDDGLTMDIVGNALKFGSLESLHEQKKYVIGFCDFINSTDLLSMTSTCYFRAAQNDILSALAEVITASDQPAGAIRFPGRIDKFAGDNIMFYFDIEKLVASGEPRRTYEEKDVYRSIYSTVTGMLHRFSAELDRIARDEETGGNGAKGNVKRCSRCGGCNNDMRRQDCVQKFRNFRSNLGLRIGLTLSTKPVYHSTLGLSFCGPDNFETDYTFTGEDVNLAARLESMKEETMLFELERARSSLSSYINRLYDSGNRDSTQIMKKRDSLNVQADDIYAISRANLSVRVNDALFREFKQHVSEPGDWKTLHIHPKGLIGTEKIHVLYGNECRRQAIDQGLSPEGNKYVPKYRYILY